MAIYKEGVSPDGLRAEALIAVERVDAMRIAVFGGQATVTSTTETKHRAKRSGHYRGDGVDFRIKDLPADDVPRFVELIKRVLGEDYVVILEASHVHTHWSPVYHASKDPQVLTA